MNIQHHEIGFDLDGVIADTGEAFIRLACEEFDYCSFRLEDITSFQVEDCLNIPGDKVEQIFHAILKDSLGTGLQPLPGAVEVITDMATQAPVTIITARSLERPVADWLAHFFPTETCKKIHLVAMGDHDDKARYIKKHNLKYFVDDRVKTCLQLAETEITPIVFQQPWNHNKHKLNSVSSWQEIHKLLNNKE
jgi:5'(3')-deoxyribonucleotidase